MRGVVREVKKQRRRNVVGEVADHAQALAQRREIKLQHVTRVEFQPRAEFLRQRVRKVAVDLDRMQFSGRGQQGPRQGPQARADFDEAFAGRGVDRSNDSRDRGFIGQKVLAEPLARLVLHAAPA